MEEYPIVNKSFVDMKKLRISKNAINAFFVISGLLLIHQFLFEGWLPAITILFFTFIACLLLQKFIFDRDVILIVSMFSVFILFLIIRIEPVFYDNITYLKLKPKVNIIVSSLLYFSTFFFAYIYGYKNKHLFKFSGYLSLFYMCAFTVRILSDFLTIRNGNNLWSGFLVMMTTPFMLFVFREKRTYVPFLFLFFMVFTFSISSRGTFLSLAVFFLSYCLYPFFVKHKRLYQLIFPFFILFIGGGMLIYIISFQYQWGHTLDELSRSVFDKSLYSGRHYMWKELLEIINEKPLVGHGAFQLSQYFVSPSHDWRNLSSHNLYLEILVRGGVVGLSLLLIVFYMLWIKLYDHNCSFYARVGAASLLGHLFHNFSVQYLLTQNMVGNTLIWFFWGACCGHVSSYKLQQKVKMRSFL